MTRNVLSKILGTLKRHGILITFGMLIAATTVGYTWASIKYPKPKEFVCPRLDQ